MAIQQQRADARRNREAIVAAATELFASVGVDYNFERIGLTTGLTVGVERPANFTPPPGQTLMAPLTGGTGGTLATQSTIVVRNEGDFSILPPGKREFPIAALTDRHRSTSRRR